MTRLLIAMISAAALTAGVAHGDSRLRIVTTTSDMADFARNIGMDRVVVTSLSRGDQDPHAVEPRPSMVVQLKKTNLLIRVGMDLDQWVESLIDAARNPSVMEGAKGYLDASLPIVKLEIPEGRIDSRMGDIHIYGNPHYWISPENAKPILSSILAKMCEISPSNADYFRKNHEEYAKRLDAAIHRWKERLKPYRGAKIVAYHNSWPYFAQCFGLVIVGFVEPKPGIPPTPSHIASLVGKMKAENVRVIVMEPYFNLRTAQSIASKAAARVAVLAPSVGGLEGTDTYIDLLDNDIARLTDALQAPR
ncbi:MAG: metal ABC transporter substrate-binding protein [Candidatus Eisenbacteria bacterium]|nr:metal ABC transporter substrate-binding protein [Candidatus Eisenbacteria bacterium]